MSKWQVVMYVIGGIFGVVLGLILTFDATVEFEGLGFATFQAIANNTPQIILEENYKKA